MFWNFLSRRQKPFLKLCEQRIEEKLLHMQFQHKLMRRFTIILPLYAGLVVTQHIFCLFLQRNTSIHIFILKLSLYQFHVSSVWDLPKGKKESFLVNPYLISFCSLIFYFICFIFYYCCCLFFGRPNVHMKKRKLIWEQKIQTTFSGQLQTVFALCAFQMRCCYLNQSKRCISILFPLQYITSQWQNA